MWKNDRTDPVQLPRESAAEEVQKQRRQPRNSPYLLASAEPRPQTLLPSRERAAG
jgi:hypothetical protein